MSRSVRHPVVYAITVIAIVFAVQPLTTSRPLTPAAQAAGGCTRNCKPTAVPTATPTKTPIPTATPLPSTLTVTTTTDPQKCPDGPGNPGYSLRCAIQGADLSGTPHQIVFAIPSTEPRCSAASSSSGAIVCTLSVARPLPPLTVSNSMIDGWSQSGAHPNTAIGAPASPLSAATNTPVASTTATGSPQPTATATSSTAGPAPTPVLSAARGNAEALLGSGVNATITIQIDGSGSAGTGLQIRSASGDTIRGLSITDFSNGAGISLLNAPGASVTGNLIGVAPNGTAHGNKTGILIQGSNGAVIGGTQPDAVNVISASYGPGIEIKSGDGTIIKGNLIGTGPGANTALGNHDGISIKGNANVVGGTGIMDGNVISGNTGSAISVQPGNSNVIQGNAIGTTPDGMTALGNHAGIAVKGDQNTIGGAGAAGNIVSSSTGTAIGVSGAGNTVGGNVVGTTADGAKPLPNGVGISLSGTKNQVGGSGATNIISANSGAGVSISKGSENLVDRNVIGTSNTGGPLGNKGNGIVANGDSGDVISNNTIANNGLNGVLVGAAAKGALTTVAITRNIFFANGHGGIKWASVKGTACAQIGKKRVGATLPCPVIQKVTSSSVSGTACNGCTVEVYVASDAQADRGFGEGKTYLGSVVANNGKWTLNLSGVTLDLAHQKVTATSTSPGTQTVPPVTSQFSFNMPVAASVSKFTAKPVTVKHTKTKYIDKTRKQSKKVKAGCVTIAKLKVCNTQTKVITIHYKVPQKVVTEAQVAVVFTWHAKQQGAVIGYYLAAGKRRLNKQRIPVHQAPDYRYRVPWKKSGPYQLVMVLKNGVLMTVPAK